MSENENDGGRGPVRRFEEVLMVELVKHLPAAQELWVRWIKDDREVPSVFVVVRGPEAATIEKVARAVEEARSRALLSRVAGINVRSENAASPGLDPVGPALVWRRRIQPAIVMPPLGLGTPS